MSVNAMDNHGFYQIGLKALVRHEDEFLFLKSPLNSAYDFPGGRIQKKEADTPLKNILAREMREELGPSFKFSIKDPIFQFRRFFKHANLRVFITVYEAEYLSGSITLSKEHTAYQWINPLENSFEQKDFLTLEEYRAFKAYLQSCHVGLKLI